MASSLIYTTLQSSVFFGHTTSIHLYNSPKKPISTISLNPSAKFNLWELMGGRGLCKGEEGLQKELKKTNEIPTNSTTEQQQQPGISSSSSSADENAFEKELLGLTGGFPGGEKGLQRFIEQNPPPKKPGSDSMVWEMGIGFPNSKPKAPELPLLMPGMIVIVKNPNNPFHMFSGIIQRVTDGKAGVLFEGGNWDKLITFRLEELERREKGPPMVSPKSAVIESMLDK
eukprot:TRINITY_DN5062_c1_g1_i1.p1 TRINITY_DN5062_c1_g1~~TRINITY_DN5062_c1_g1_i1.p1  ORF type:complete len:250 (-),score=71.20 TRINITY_DN5062_c1_g1_i1:234-917(-)